MLPASVRDLERIGGAVCLDFVNTVDPRYVSDRIEYLPDYDALLEWSIATGLLDRSGADRLGDIARHRPQLARAVHRRALALREALFELLRREPGPDLAASLETLNAELARSRTQQVVERVLGGHCPRPRALADRIVGRRLAHVTPSRSGSGVRG